jgi:O-antigen/teichoic acid export membrane protein
MGTVPQVEVATPVKSEQLRLQRWLPWVGKGSLAVLDQGLFAGSNFLLNVLLARWLAPTDYGAFALAYSVFLLLLVLHSALLTAPMLVFGPGKYRERFPEYLGILLRGHFAVMLVVAALLIVTALLLERLYSQAVGQAFFGLAVAGPIVLLLWLLRRAFYARLSPGWAAAGGVIYFVVFIVSILTLRTTGQLTPATSFLTMAAGSFIACLCLLALLRPTMATTSATIRAVAADHWRYGKWVTASAGPSWIIDNVYYLVLPAWVGLAAAGGLKALLNLAMPASHTMAAVGVLLQPILVRDRDRGGLHVMKRTIKVCLTLFLLGSTCYLALLWGFQSRIFQVLYAGKYAYHSSWPLLLVSLLPLAQSVPLVVGAALGALEKPNLAFSASIGGAAASLVLGVPLASRLGVSGALLGFVASYVVIGALTLLFVIRVTHSEECLVQK